jgi:transposase InsO family protein
VQPLVEAAVAEIRRKHPRWGSKRIRLELLRRLPATWPEGVAPPAERTVNRILLRQGLARPRPRKRPRSSYRRFERPAPMQLWGVDIVEGIWLVNEATGVLREAKVVTGVDDHSRFCVMAMVTERATSRAVCYAFAQALVKFGAPEEVLSDNGKQFTDRFGKGGEVMFDRICRKNGIRHRLTEPASPNQNGKVERFQGTLRPDFFDVTGPFPASRQRSRRSTPGWLTTTMSGRTRRWTRSGPSPRRSGSRPSRPSSVSCCRCGSRPPWHRRTLSIMPTSSIMTRLPIMVGLSIMIVRLVLRSRRGRPRSSARWLNGRVVRSSSTWWCRRRGT